MLSSSLILSKILSRCPHCFNFDGVTTSSLPAGKYFFSIRIWKFKLIFRIISAACYFQCTNHYDLLVTSPMSGFMVVDVFLPFMPNLCRNFSKMKVPWLQLSKSA